MTAGYQKSQARVADRAPTLFRYRAHTPLRAQVYDDHRDAAGSAAPIHGKGATP